MPFIRFAFIGALHYIVAIGDSLTNQQEDLFSALRAKLVVFVEIFLVREWTIPVVL